MALNSLTPDLMVEDVEETVEWYERVFDAELDATLPFDQETGDWWAQVHIDDVSLMFQDRESLMEKLPALEDESIGGSLALYVDVDDAEALHEQLGAADVEIIKQPHVTDFGWRQFAAKDCNGYILWFGEKLDREGAREIGRRQRSLVRRHHG